MCGLSLIAASGGHSSSWCMGLSLSRPSTNSRRTGSVVVAHGPSCSAAFGILPDPGSNPCPLHWQADSQPLRHQGSPGLFYNSSSMILRICWNWERWVLQIHFCFFVFQDFKFYLFIFSAVWGLCCCVWAFSSCGERGLLFIALCGLLLVVASLVMEHRLQELWHAGSVVMAHGLICSAACGIIPDQGSNPCPPHWQTDSFFFFHAMSETFILTYFHTYFHTNTNIRFLEISYNV